MTERRFLDTNVLVYADDLDAGPKCSRAREILREALEAGTGVTSTQVLQEFFVVSTRKLGVPADVARRKVELLARMDVVRIEVGDLLGAIDLHRLHSISFWDALVVRCAQRAGCRVLLSEDLQDGRTFDGVRVEDPFRERGPVTGDR
jgi:predicted nucleic acid-binding protein